ncbi:hypothetical protein [Longispora albida]|uniref:hypothetical protein n=1 Tax=Longispora albida TaxID=203523 RepID=UPI0003A42D58|nr:hypothetical protein [Longispora albida]
MGRHSQPEWVKVAGLDVTGVDRATRRGRVVGVALQPLDAVAPAAGGDWLELGQTYLHHDGTDWIASRRGPGGQITPIGRLAPTPASAADAVSLVGLPGPDGPLELTAGGRYVIDYQGEEGALWQWQDEQ